LVLAGITYEQIGERRDRTRFPQVGRSVDIGGHSLNIYCSGSGGPAVILGSGGSAPGCENPRDFCRDVEDDLTILLPAIISKFVVEFR
jgi:hypothetical protein